MIECNFRRTQSKLPSRKLHTNATASDFDHSRVKMAIEKFNASVAALIVLLLGRQIQACSQDFGIFREGVRLGSEDKNL